MCLPGLEHVISVSIAPLTNLQTPFVPLGGRQEDVPKNLPRVHIRTHAIKTLPSGTRVPRVGAFRDGSLCILLATSTQEADSEVWKAAIKRPKLKKGTSSGVGEEEKLEGGRDGRFERMDPYCEARPWQASDTQDEGVESVSKQARRHGRK